MKDVALKHQLKIARRTLQLTDAGAIIMGGMTKEEAKELLRKHTQYRPPRRKAKRKT